MALSRDHRGAVTLLVTTVLLAAGVRLSEEPAVEAVARAVRARPIAHAAAAASWAAEVLSARQAPAPAIRARCRGRRGP